MPSASTLESLTIEINGTAKGASESISAMIAPLRSLARSVGTVVPALKSLNRELRALKASGINLKTLMGADDLAKQGRALKGWVNSMKDFKSKASVMPKFANKVKAGPGYFSPDMYGPKPFFNPNNRQPYNSNDSLALQLQRYVEENGGKNPYKNFPGIAMPDGTIKYATGANGEQIAQYFAGKMYDAAGEKFAKIVQDAKEPPKISTKPIENSKLYEIADEIKNSEKASSGVEGVKNALKGAETASAGATTALKNVDKELKQKNKDGKSAKNGLDSAASGIRNVGNAAEGNKKKTSGFGKALSSIGRMAKSLLIRTALRSMMKAFGESWQSAYAFSQHMGGSFAKSIDTVRGAFTSVSFSVIQTFAPILEAIVPIVVTVANAINYLCSVIQSLFSLLGLTSDLLGASASQMDKFRKSSGGGGSSKKGQLAKFDELNVIQSSAGGGGGSGAGSGLGLFESVSAEIDAIKATLVGEGLIALGLIMACTGHIPLGVAMIAVGAASLYKVALDWEKLPEDVKKTVSKIGYTAGTIMFGAGLILACAGHPVMGIGLMVAGAASVAGTAALNWNTMPEKTKNTILKIGFLAGTVLFGAGLVLACAGHPAIGIGMMVAGAASVAGAAALNWNTMPKKTKNTILKIGFLAGTVLFGTGLILACAGHPAIGIGMMVAGAAAVATPVALKWNKLTDDVKGKILEIGVLTSIGMMATGLIIAFACPAHLALGIALMVAGVAGITAVGLNWNKIPRDVQDTIALISFIAGLGLASIGLVIALCCPAHLGLGIAMIAAGVALTAVGINWSRTSDKVSQVIDDILITAGIGALAIGLILALSGANLPLGIGMIVAGGAMLGTAIALDWGELKTKATFIMTDIAAWFVKKWGEITSAVNKAKQAVEEYINKLIGIKNPESLKVGSANLPTITNVSGLVSGVAGSITKPGTSPYIVKDSKKVMTTILDSVFKADGAYGIPAGDLFIANEAGAELVGSMNGKTTVANQGQIIEGIQRGVSDANAEQNNLLRQQNSLLQQILEKDSSVRLGASSALGRIVTQSQQMYAKQVGG